MSPTFNSGVRGMVLATRDSLGPFCGGSAIGPATAVGRGRNREGWVRDARSWLAR